MSKNLDAATPVSCKCGWSGVAAEVLWYWKEKDMSDFGGYRPVCKHEFNGDRVYTDLREELTDE